MNALAHILAYIITGSACFGIVLFINLVWRGEPRPQQALLSTLVGVGLSVLIEVVRSKAVARWYGRLSAELKKDSDAAAISAMERLLPYLTDEQKQKLLDQANRMAKRRGEQ